MLAYTHDVGVGANILLGFKLGGGLTQELKFNPALPSVPLPGGFSGGGLDIGPSLNIAYLAAISSVSAQAELAIGTKMTIDDSASTEIIMLGSGDSSSSGWTPHFEQLGPELSASVSVSAVTGPEISVELSVAFLGFGLTAGVLLAAPQLTAKLSADAYVAIHTGHCRCTLTIGTGTPPAVSAVTLMLT